MLPSFARQSQDKFYQNREKRFAYSLGAIARPRQLDLTCASARAKPRTLVRSRWWRPAKL